MVVSGSPRTRGPSALHSPHLPDGGLWYPYTNPPGTLSEPTQQQTYNNIDKSCRPRREHYLFCTCATTCLLNTWTHDLLQFISVYILYLWFTPNKCPGSYLEPTFRGRARPPLQLPMVDTR